MSIVDIHAPAGDGYGVIYARPGATASRATAQRRATIPP